MIISLYKPGWGSDSTACVLALTSTMNSERKPGFPNEGPEGQKNIYKTVGVVREGP